MNDRTHVATYNDIARETDLSRREIDGAVHALNERDDPVLVLSEWLVGEKDIQPLESQTRLYRVVVVPDETAKAWRVATGDDDGWVPKSQSELLQRAAGVEEIQTPTKTLGEFGGVR